LCGLSPLLSGLAPFFSLLLFLQSLFLFQLNHKQSVELQGDDQGVLAGEEDVHVGDETVVGDQQHTKNKERCILEVFC